MLQNVQEFISAWKSDGGIATIIAARKNDQNPDRVPAGHVPASAGDLFTVHLKGRAKAEAIAEDSNEAMEPGRVKKIDAIHNNIRGYDVTGYNYKNPTEPGCFACVGVDFIVAVKYDGISYLVKNNGEFDVLQSGSIAEAING